MTSASVKITILVDNQARDGLVAEHGLSLWIETEGRHILFDTGQGNALENNARALGVDLGTTDILILSHGHYDHAGGIAQVLPQARKANVYCNAGVVCPRYSISGGKSKSVQMPREAMAAIDELSSRRLRWVQKPTALSENMGITGPIPRETSYEDCGGSFYLDPEGRRADPIDDDLALWIRKENGLIACVGCAHSGLVNTLNYVRCLNDGLRIRAVVGGFHLLNASRERIEQTMAALRLLAPDRVVPCHCTGKIACGMLGDAFGEKAAPGAAGMTYQF